jgi:large repetitive protein
VKRSRSRGMVGWSVGLGLALATSAGLAQPAYMVADLDDTVRYGYDLFSGPLSEHLEVAGKFYFFSDDGVHGRELWRSDGTALGTYLIRDLCPGTCGSRFPNWNDLAPLGDRVVFAADDGVHGVELWVTDGTALGTHLVADLRPGYASAFIQTLTAAGGQVFFTALRDEETSALWRTDGTAKGTYPITPPGPGVSFAPTSIHPGPGFLYLCNASWAGQSGLWRSDGSPAGTTFVAAVDCWQNSIGKRGTMLVSPDGLLYFQGQVESPGPVDPELWRSDGTSAGTWRVKDIAPGDNGSWPSGLVFFGGELLFTAEGLSGTELWRSDGTEAGTTPIPLPDDGHPFSGWGGSWTIAAGRYFFVATDESHGAEPWVYDGLMASRVADLVPGPDSSIIASFPNYFVPFFEDFGSEALFSATDGVFGTELWRTDGTAAGTVRISDIAPGPASVHLPIFWGGLESSLGGRPMVVENQATTGERLWRLNASGSAMELVDVLDAQTSSFERVGTDRLSLYEAGRGDLCFEGVGSRLFFEHRRAGEQQVDLFRTDGALSPPEGVLQALAWSDQLACGSQGEWLLYPRVPDLNPGDDMELVAIHALSDATEVVLPTGAFLVTWPPFLERAGRQVFGTSFSLFETDGTASGTSLLATEMEEFGGRIDLFLGEIVEVGNALRMTDAAEPTGARILLQDDGDGTFPEIDLAPLGPKLVFVATDPAHGSELWSSDGTPEGTALLVDSIPGATSLFRRAFSADRYWEIRAPRLLGADTFAVLAGTSATAGEELWVTDGTAVGTGLLRDIYPGDYPSTPRQFTRLGSRIVFSAEDEEHGLELWVTDGTFPGTTLLKDVAPGLASSVPDDLAVRDGTLYFSAWSPNYGREAWKSDGTTAGTVRISDVAPGPLSSSPQRFARAGNRLYFSATDQVHGFELWAISDDGSVPLFLDGFENESTDRWSDSLP